MNQRWHAVRPLCMLVVGVLGLITTGSAATQTAIDPNGIRASGSVLDDRIFYQIGGGRAVSTFALEGAFASDTAAPGR